MNTLLITLGNSEIQFHEQDLGGFTIENGLLKKDHVTIPVRKNNRHGQQSYWLPISSREAGKLIHENYENFASILHFPIVEPLVEFIPSKDIKRVIFVVTNQEDKTHSKGDTLYYAPIIQRYFEEKGLTLIEYNIEEVSQNVKDSDKQYAFFGHRLNSLFSDDYDEDEYYLFAQGGIDQINHAITLQLLQRFKDRVSIYQKAEGEEIREVGFPQLFLRDLTKQKIIKHLEDYDFGKAHELFLQKSLNKELCWYAKERLNLQHSSLFPSIQHHFKAKILRRLEKSGIHLLQEFKPLSKPQKNKILLTDLYRSIRIKLHQKNFRGGLMDYFTLFENLFSTIIECEFDIPLSDKIYNPTLKVGDKNTKLNNALGKIDDDLYKYIDEHGVWLHNPSRRLYSTIYKFLLEKNIVEYKVLSNNQEVLSFINGIENLAEKRNGVAHGLKSINENEYYKHIERAKLSESKINNNIEQLLGISKGFGRYKIIRDKILQNL